MAGGAPVGVHGFAPLDGFDYASGTGTTSSSGQVSIQVNNAPAGLYSTLVTNVVLSGYDWDEIAPDSTFDKVD